MDIRHPLTVLDRQLLDWLRAAQRRTHILFTKADKLSRQAALAALTAARRALARDYPGISAQLFSSPKRQGLDDAAEALGRAVDDFRAQKTRAPAKGE